jgi:acetyl esterase/lipase
MTWLRANADDLGVDLGRIALLGRSAGGHLALLAAFTADASDQQPPCCVIAFYAPSDLTRLYGEARRSAAEDLRGGLCALLGTAPSDRSDEYQLASPLRRVHSRVPPTLLVHGLWDSVIPPDHSTLLARALVHEGVRARRVAVPCARHAFDLIGYGPATMLAREAVFAFLADPLDRHSASKFGLDVFE